MFLQLKNVGNSGKLKRCSSCRDARSIPEVRHPNACLRLAIGSLMDHGYLSQIAPSGRLRRHCRGNILIQSHVCFWHVSCWSGLRNRRCGNCEPSFLFLVGQQHDVLKGCILACTNLHVCVYIYIHMDIYTNIYKYHQVIHIHTCIYIYTHVYIYVYMYIYLCIYMYIHIYTYVYIIYIHTYTYIYIYTYTDI